MISNKRLIYFFVGILIIIFSISYDLIQKNPFYLGPFQIILLLFGVAILALYKSTKFFFLIFSFNIGILFAIMNSNYFLGIDETPLIKKNIEKLDENIINNDLSNIKRFYLKSKNFIDQTQFINLFVNDVKSNIEFTNFNYKNFNVQKRLPVIKKKIIREYYDTHKDILLHDLNIKILNQVKKEKFKILVLEFDALPDIKAIANIYVPLDLTKTYPTVFSVPGCGENIWTDYPSETDPQHRMELLASNKMVGITSISLCSNSNFTKNHRFESFKLVTNKNENLHKADLQALIWMRIIRFQEEFKFIDSTKLGITGYSSGASVIKKLLFVDDKIESVALVGTNIKDIFGNDDFTNFSYQRIVESENENYHWSLGSPSLDKIVNNVLKEANLNIRVWRNLLPYEFRKNFYFLYGSNDDVVDQGAKRNRKKNIDFLNKVNKVKNRDIALQIFENSENHNFSTNNNLLVVKYFKKQFFNEDTVNQFIKIKKNNKNELAPIIHKFDLKKYYVDNFKKKLDYSKLNYNEDDNIDVLYKNLRLDKLKQKSKPILLLSENIELNNKDIQASFFSLGVNEKIESYFYEFTNSNFYQEKINIIVSSKLENFDDLKSIILNGSKTYVLILPGYGISNPKFTTIGNISINLLKDKSQPLIAGLGVRSIELLKNFISKNANNEIYEYFAYDFESNIILYFFKIIKDDYFNFKSFNFSRNLDEFLNIKENTSLPAILFIDNLDQVFSVIQNLDIKKYNIESSGSTDYTKFIFSI
ncbi:MAG: hypothetical protein CMK44_00220 [Porticoccus sp.]|nr:hypothetical protein [Porticoccus sp.]